MKKYLGILLIALTVLGCSSVYAYPQTINLTYNNQSSHNVKVELKGNKTNVTTVPANTSNYQGGQLTVELDGHATPIKFYNVKDNSTMCTCTIRILSYSKGLGGWKFECSKKNHSCTSKIDDSGKYDNKSKIIITIKDLQAFN